MVEKGKLLPRSAHFKVCGVCDRQGQRRTEDPGILAVRSRRELRLSNHGLSEDSVLVLVDIMSWMITLVARDKLALPRGQGEHLHGRARKTQT